MNRRDIVVCLLWSAALLGRVHAQQTGKVYHVAVISPNAQLSDMGEASHDQAMARLPEHFIHQRLIAELAETSRLPTIYPWREGVEAGGFMAYAFELLDLFRYSADIIAKILAGAKPSDMPFYQARKFELSFNLKTAKALGIEIPSFLVARADKLID